MHFFLPYPPPTPELSNHPLVYLQFVGATPTAYPSYQPTAPPPPLPPPAKSGMALSFIEPLACMFRTFFFFAVTVSTLYFTFDKNKKGLYCCHKGMVHYVFWLSRCLFNSLPNPTLMSLLSSRQAISTLLSKLRFIHTNYYALS